MNKIDDIFHVVHLTDDKAKLLAMELANDKGRLVLEKIFEGRKSSSELAKELNMGLPTVLFHVERLLETGLIKVIDTNLSKKFREIKYYGPSKQAILIIPSSVNQEDMTAPLLSRATARIAGATSVIGACLSAVLLNVFSKEVTISGDRTFTEPLFTGQETVSEATKIPTEAVGEMIRTLPSIEATVGIILVSVAVSVMVVWGIGRLCHRNRARATYSESLP